MNHALISLDCGSNGLHGAVFAAAAVLYINGDPSAHWTIRRTLPEPWDPWVAEHVLPAINHMPETTWTDGTGYTYEDMLEAWRTCYQVYADRATASGCDPNVLVLTHIPWPVEARFLWDAHQHNPFSGPYPLLDLASMLYACGHDPTSVDAYVNAHGLTPSGVAHDPLTDARTTADVFHHLMSWRGVLTLPVEREVTPGV